MTSLKDIINFNTNSSHSSAVVLDTGLFDENLITSFSPTHSSVQVLKSLSKAVLPAAPADLRAMNWYGSYGSGKSHLATLIGQLLRDGASTPVFIEFLNKLQNFEEKKLPELISKSFLAPSDPDAKPYLLVPLYGSQTPSIASKLMEGLFKALELITKSDPKIDIKNILPTTEYDIAIKRYREIIEKDPTYEDKMLSDWDIDAHYYDTDELFTGLERHEPSALDLFSLWHEKVCYGALFQPQNDGGKGFVEAYEDAAKNLQKHGFGGIAIIWDEFGNALEDLLRTPQRRPIDEIIELQRFVETVCQPSLGHVLFIGLTHVSMAEYGARSNAGQDIQDRLGTIEGRFTPIKIELKASEVEGYHLLGAQTIWSEKGNELYHKSTPRLDELSSTLSELHIFTSMRDELHFIIKSCYPLHPIASAALFAISTRYAQATRTAFTFIRDLDLKVWNSPISDSGLFQSEFIRLPALIEYYSDSLGKKAKKDLRKYQKAIAEIGTENKSKKDILSVLFLSTLLDDNFRSTDNFLSISLYDRLSEDSIDLYEDLTWLKDAGLIWKNDMTKIWTLAGEAGVDPESLIADMLTNIPSINPKEMLLNNKLLQEDLLPIIGTHELEPSKSGIIRSFSVHIVTTPLDFNSIVFENSSISANVLFVFTKDKTEAQNLRDEIRRTPNKTAIPNYYWISDLEHDDLIEKFRFYLATNKLIAENTYGEGLKRQIEAKFESNRQNIMRQLDERFGRKGLKTGNTTILLSGNENAIACKSWEDFKNILFEHVNDLYPKEIAIRNPSLNIFADESYNGRKNMNKIVERILDFETNPAYQNDLLGNSEGKQESAIIDGLLGKYSNDLFIERADKFDIKTIDETNGNVSDILKLISTELLRRRDNPFEIKKLREKLMKPPYGLPPSVHSIFTAIAVRKEMHRLEWVGVKQRDFAKQLGKAYMKGTTLRLRVQDLTSKQQKILKILASVLDLTLDSTFNEVEKSKKIISSLRTKIVNLPDFIKNSPKLSPKGKLLIDVVLSIGNTTHDIANDLISMTSFNEEWQIDHEILDYKKTINDLNELFDHFELLSNERLFVLKDTIKNKIIKDETKQDEIIAILKKDGSEKSNRMAELFTNKDSFDEDTLKSVTDLFIEKPYEECTDIELGQLTGDLKIYINDIEKAHKQKVGYKIFKPSNYNNLIEEEQIDFLVDNLKNILTDYDTDHDKKIISSAVLKLSKDL